MTGPHFYAKLPHRLALRKAVGSGSEELALPGVSGDAGDALEAAMNRRWVGRAPSISQGQKWRDVSCGPDLKRVAVLRAVGDPNVEFAMTSLNRAAPDLGITLVPVDINRPTTSNPRLPISKEARQRPSS